MATIGPSASSVKLKALADFNYCLYVCYGDKTAAKLLHSLALRCAAGEASKDPLWGYGCIKDDGRGFASAAGISFPAYKNRSLPRLKWLGVATVKTYRGQNGVRATWIKLNFGRLPEPPASAIDWPAHRRKAPWRGERRAKIKTLVRTPQPHQQPSPQATLPAPAVQKPLPFQSPGTAAEIKQDFKASYDRHRRAEKWNSPRAIMNRHKYRARDALHAGDFQGAAYLLTEAALAMRKPPYVAVADLWLLLPQTYEDDRQFWGAMAEFGKVQPGGERGEDGELIDAPELFHWETEASFHLGLIKPSPPRVPNTGLKVEQVMAEFTGSKVSKSVLPKPTDSKVARHFDRPPGWEHLFRRLKADVLRAGYRPPAVQKCGNLLLYR
jgi:hypothetical protein